MHCSKGVQPMPKAVHHSGFYDKHVTADGGIWTLVLSHSSQARSPTFLETSFFQNPEKGENLANNGT